MKNAKLKVPAAAIIASCILSACGGSATSSIVQSEAPQSTQSVVAESSPTSDVIITDSAVSENATVDTGTWVNYSYTINTLDYAGHALLQISVPPEWQHPDDSTVFSVNDIKCLEVSYYEPYEDPSDPFTAFQEMLDGGGDPDGDDAGPTFETFTIPCSRNNECRVYSSVADGADFEWYPYFIYVDCDGVVVLVSYYSLRNDRQADLPIIGAIIDNMNIIV